MASVAGMLAIGLALVAVLTPSSAQAIEVKKSLYASTPGPSESGGGPAPANPLTPALRQKLSDTIATESDSYVAQESEKKASGETYVDLESAKFKYIPAVNNGKTEVTAKLEAPEYKGPKSGTGRGAPTGKRKVLVFKYRLDGQDWAEVAQPAWQDAEQGNKQAAGK
ncbi:MAG: hypothetical protein WA005_03690 [Candidatus Binataceae bacterium]